MAASEMNPPAEAPTRRAPRWLASGELRERLEEEISRAERHGTQLSCLLLSVENLEELAARHGSELREQALEYLAAALEPELRRFDAIGRPGGEELVIVLPGADGPQGEIVARRVLERLRTIKVEADGVRTALRTSAGLAAWRDGLTAGDLLAAARAAGRAGEENGIGEAGPT